MNQETSQAICGPQSGHYFDAGWTGSFLEVQLLSDLGRKRQNNEDACLLYAPEDEALIESRGVLVAVADGMGGASAGEYASRNTLHQLYEKYYDKSLKTLIPNALRLAVESANAFIFGESELNPEYSGMGTTVSALAIVGNWAYMAQVGDSRIYLMRRDQPIKQLTHDHSLVAEQIRNGLINEEEARNHSLKNLITRAVGIKESVDVDLFALELHESDTLLLCSDGLCNMVDDDTICAVFAGDNLRDATRDIVQRALDAGGNDNITVVTVRVNAPPPATHYQQGARLISLTPEGVFSRFRRFFSRG